MCMQVHPLFVLSIVDTMLSIMWISGAAVWLHNQGNLYGQRVGCFAINLTTVVSLYSYTVEEA